MDAQVPIDVSLIRWTRLLEGCRVHLLQIAPDVSSHRPSSARLFLTTLFTLLPVAGTPLTRLHAQSRFTCDQWRRLTTHRKLGITEALIRLEMKNRVIIRLSAEYYVRELDTLI